jgi:hypothetical protein
VQLNIIAERLLGLRRDPVPCMQNPRRPDSCQIGVDLVSSGGELRLFEGRG